MFYLPVYCANGPGPAFCFGFLIKMNGCASNVKSVHLCDVTEKKWKLLRHK